MTAAKLSSVKNSSMKPARLSSKFHLWQQL